MIFRFRVPVNVVNTPQGTAVIAPSEFRTQTTNLWSALDFMAVVKPERILGASWMDDFVALRKNLVLCADCCRRYGNWWAHHNYKPDLAHEHWSDCDGCSRKLTIVTMFAPEDTNLAEESEL